MKTNETIAVDSPTAEKAAVDAWTNALGERGRAIARLQADARAHAAAQREATAAHGMVREMGKSSTASDYGGALHRRTLADAMQADALAQLMLSAELYDAAEKATQRAQESYVKARGQVPVDPSASYTAELLAGNGAVR